jgi:hypothetical protein
METISNTSKLRFRLMRFIFSGGFFLREFMFAILVGVLERIGSRNLVEFLNDPGDQLT